MGLLMSDETYDPVEGLVTEMHRPSRVVTTNDATVCVDKQWVKDITNAFRLTAVHGLAKPERSELERYMQHVTTLADAVDQILDSTKPRA